MRGEGRHAPKLERRERDTNGQDLEHTRHDELVIQVSGGSMFGSLEGDRKSGLLRHVQLPQGAGMLAQQTQQISRATAAPIAVPAQHARCGVVAVVHGND